jgi:hypothetical protein
MRVEKIACKVEFFSQSRLQVNEILMFFFFQVNDALKFTSMISTFTYYNHNISNL